MSDIFDNLSKAQIDALNYVAFNGYAGGRPPHGRTAEILVGRGLIVPEVVEEPFGGGLTFKRTTYHMPLHVHCAWCFHLDDGTSLDVDDDPNIAPAPATENAA